MFCKKRGFLKNSQNSQENFFKEETLAQVFSCEFCKNFKNTFFVEHLWTTASRLTICQSLKSLTIFIKNSIIVIWEDSENNSDL